MNRGGLCQLTASLRVTPKRALREIRRAFAATGGEHNLAARRLGVSADTLYRLCKQYPEVAEAIRKERERQGYRPRGRGASR